MITVLYISALFLGLIGALYERRIKWVEILVLGVIIYLMARGAKTLDTFNYLWWYQKSTSITFSETYEKGYLLLMKLGQMLGLSYLQFRFFIVIISFILISRTVNKLTNKTQYVYFFYLLFLIFIDTVQVRNFFAFSLVIYGIHFLLLKEKKAVLYFVICTILATSIHIGSIFALAFLLLGFRNRKSLIRFIVILTLVLSLLIFVAGNKFSFLRSIFELLQSETNTQRLEGYITGHTSLGFLYAFSLTAVDILIVFFAKKIAIREYNKAFVRGDNKKVLELLSKKREIINGIYWLNLISIVFFPFYMLNLQFVRLARNLILVNLIGLSIIQKSILKIGPRLIFLNFCLIITLFFWFFYSFLLPKHVEDILIPFFDNATF